VKMRLITLLVIVAALGGCAIFDNRPPEEIVGERAQTRLDLLLSKDFERSYQHMTPGYRAIHTVDQYTVDFAGSGMWTDTSIATVGCTRVGEAPVTACKVVALISYPAPRMGYIQTTEVTENWVLLDGRWYMNHK
jgi:hypothetical protein